jgi:surfeit locus 1 family protein
MLHLPKRPFTKENPRVARFRPGGLPTLFALLATAVLGGLGTWQVQRLHWKEAWLARQHAQIARPPLGHAEALATGEDAAFRRVRARGRYDPGHSILVHHVPRDGREGSRVITPLLLDEAEGAPALLVDRGWIPHAAVQGFLELDRPEGETEVEGMLFLLDLAAAEPGRRAERRVHWVHFDPARHAALLQEQLPYRVAPLLLQRGDDAEDGLPLGGFELPRSRVDHRSYAITWYSMAAVCAAVWVGFGLQRGRRDRP